MIGSWLLHAAVVLLHQTGVTELTAAAGAALREGRGAEALALAEKAIAADPQSQDALNNAGFIAEALGQDDQAQSLFQRSHQLNPSAIYPLQMLGAIAYDQGRLDDSESHYRAALALAPGDENLQRDLDSILERQRTMARFSEARGRLRAALVGTLVGYAALAGVIALVIRKRVRRSS
jgi:tetratricopeptide (TPR) repeat protein